MSLSLSPAFITNMGLVAAALSALTFFPQVLRTWKARSAASLSGPMLGVGASGMVLWIVYGIAEDNLPVLLGNAVNLVFTTILIGFKFYFTAPDQAGLDNAE